jgi:hypothetical protein
VRDEEVLAEHPIGGKPVKLALGGPGVLVLRERVRWIQAAC